MSQIDLNFLPIYPRSQRVNLIGSSQTFCDREDISQRSCLINALNYEQIFPNSVFQIGTLIAYDYNLKRWDTFYSFHVWAINLSQQQLVDFSLPRLPSVAIELNFNFGKEPSQMFYTIIRYAERQKAWNALSGDGDEQPHYFGEANLIYVPGALPSTISIAPSDLVMILVQLTAQQGYLQNLNLTVEKIQNRLDPYGENRLIFSVMTLNCREAYKTQ